LPNAERGFVPKRTQGLGVQEDTSQRNIVRELFDKLGKKKTDLALEQILLKLFEAGVLNDETRKEAIALTSEAA